MDYRNRLLYVAFSDNSDIMIIRVGAYRESPARMSNTGGGGGAIPAHSVAPPGLYRDIPAELRPRYWAGRAKVGVRLTVIA